MTRLLRSLIALAAAEVGHINDRTLRIAAIDKVAERVWRATRNPAPQTITYDTMQRIDGEWWVCARAAGGEWELRRATAEEAELVLDAFAQASDELGALRNQAT